MCEILGTISWSKIPDANCTEIEGGYQCACNEGYRGDGVNVCLDIDECAELKCSMFSTCENSIGSYEFGYSKLIVSNN